jgi:hypothetical protein
VTCSICESRKAKRACPALRSEICPQCCGKEREESLNCPFDCVYLIEARAHERRAGLDPANFPYKEVRITEDFLREQEELLNFTAQAVTGAALQTPGAVDHDASQALDAMVRTYKSLESGIYYQTMPDSPLGQAIVARVQEQLQQFRTAETERLGMARTRDTDVLGILVFLLRMALDEDNGRRLGRRFLDLLQRHFESAKAPAAPLIVSG